ncbi:ribonuclease T2 family protein [Aestuariivirga sp.]|uniref:ribonuclease T2 family protein n=1 Tax=Aestuariivirga sp. TaxID=2650926 RepID=UPI00391DD389
MRRLLLFIAAAAFGLASARADEPIEGEFIAERVCPAMLSLRKGTNPDLAVTGPGISYRLLARNRKKATHYRIELPGAAPPERWVAADCGRIVKAAEPKKPATDLPAYVLAVSWQPAFCEANASKPECRFQTATRFDGSNFALHGLWPQPRTKQYCGASRKERQASAAGKWKDLPPLDLMPLTRAELDEVMPGSRSHLDRHEWIKHGTCYPGRDPETYYRDTLRLMDLLNRSPVRDLLAENIGRTVTSEEIRGQFDVAFGEGAGERVRVACRDDGGRRLIAEITIGLRGDLSGRTPISQLILGSVPTDPGCPGGVVDPVGLQ